MKQRCEKIKGLHISFIIDGGNLKHMKIDFSLGIKGLNALLVTSIENYWLSASVQTIGYNPILDYPEEAIYWQTNHAKILFAFNHHRMPGNTSVLINPVHLANAVFIIYNPKPLDIKTY